LRPIPWISPALPYHGRLHPVERVPRTQHVANDGTVSTEAQLERSNPGSLAREDAGNEQNLGRRWEFDKIFRPLGEIQVARACFQKPLFIFRPSRKYAENRVTKVPGNQDRQYLKHALSCSLA
jgi:hypothetical protein